MIEKEIVGRFDSSWCMQHPGWKYFVNEMSDKQYGAEALNDAWVWFKAGYEAACDV